VRARSDMHGSGIALTCKAAFEAFEQSHCRRLEHAVDALQAQVEAAALREAILISNVRVLGHRCAVYAARFEALNDGGARVATTHVPYEHRHDETL